LHSNQYYHLMRWLQAHNLVTASQYEKLKQILSEVKYSTDNRLTLE